MTIDVDEAAFLHHLSDDATLVFDVGGAGGRYTRAVLARWPAATVHVFEPRIDAAAGIRHGFRDASVIVHQAAVGEVEGAARLVVADNVEHSHLRQVLPGNEVLDVTVTTVDAELERLGWPQLDLLKIDTEGWEIPVLRGAAESLRRGLIAAVQFEYGGTWIGRHHLSDASPLLPGMQVFRFDGEGRPFVEERSFHDDYAYRNYLALRT